MQFRYTASALVAAGLTTVAQGVSLSDFTPRIDNLPSQCQSVYVQTITGCQAGDFSQGTRCSSLCIDGLISISQAVTRQCRNVDVPETSIIGVFLLGQGIPALCAGITVTTVNAPDTTYTSTIESTQPPSQPAAAPTTSQQDDAQTTRSPDQPAASTTLQTSASSSASDSAGAPPTNDPVPPPPPTFGMDTSTPSSTSNPAQQPTQTPNSQKSNADSGGGSPFDVQATASAPPPPARLPSAATLGLVAALALLCAIL